MAGHTSKTSKFIKSTGSWITPDRLNTPLQCAWPALKLSLTVFEKTLDGVPIPGLKGLIGGILQLAKTEEVSVGE